MNFHKIVLFVDDYEDLGTDYVIEKLNEIEYIGIHVTNIESKEVGEDQYDNVLHFGNFESIFNDSRERH